MHISQPFSSPVSDEMKSQSLLAEVSISVDCLSFMLSSPLAKTWLSIVMQTVMGVRV